MSVQRIGVGLWFDGQAEAAAQFYTSIFKNSRITASTRYTDTGHEMHKMRAGTVMTVAFELEGLPFTALNGGPQFTFNESVSFQVFCDTQQEIDYYWDRLSDGGNPKAQQCGWLKDKFGVSWQVVPSTIGELMTDPDPAKSQRVMQAVLGMKKIDMAALMAARGEAV